jgi:hypothetical protein
MSSPAFFEAVFLVTGLIFWDLLGATLSTDATDKILEAHNSWPKWKITFKKSVGRFIEEGKSWLLRDTWK